MNITDQTEIQKILTPYGRQADAAREFNINTRTVRRWRSGSRTPSPEMCARLREWADSLPE